MDKPLNFNNQRFRPAELEWNGAWGDKCDFHTNFFILPFEIMLNLARDSSFQDAMILNCVPCLKQWIVSTKHPVG